MEELTPTDILTRSKPPTHIHLLKNYIKPSRVARELNIMNLIISTFDYLHKMRYFFAKQTVLHKVDHIMEAIMSHSKSNIVTILRLHILKLYITGLVISFYFSGKKYHKCALTRMHVGIESLSEIP